MTKQKNGKSSIGEPLCETCAEPTTFFSKRHYDGHFDCFSFGVNVPVYTNISDEKGSRTEVSLVVKPRNYSLTPKIDGNLFKMSSILRTGVIPQVCSPLGGMSKLQVASITDAVASSLLSEYDSKVAEAEEQLKQQPLEQQPLDQQQDSVISQPSNS